MHRRCQEQSCHNRVFRPWLYQLFCRIGSIPCYLPFQLIQFLTPSSFAESWIATKGIDMDQVTTDNIAHQESHGDQYSDLQLPHGWLHMPAFMPDATLGVVRSVDRNDLLGCAVQGC